MNNAELIDVLTDICVQQADVIKAQAAALAQFHAQVREEDAAEQRERLRQIAGDWE